MTAFSETIRLDKVVKTAPRVVTSVGVDLRDGARVVVKSLAAPELSPAALGRLEYEVRALGELGISSAPIFFERTDDRVSVVRRFVPGDSLAERLTTGPLTVRAAIRLALDVLAVLEPAHQAGILHGGIKPSNVIVGSAPDARFELVDFAVARAVQSDGATESIATEETWYLSPEQCGLLSGGLDARSDLYALGVVLYHALRGRPPFEGQTLGEVLRQHVGVRPPSLRTARPEVPSALAAIVERLLRKDPRDRYQTARGAIADLEALAAAIDRGDADPDIVIGGRDSRRILTEPAFIGRAKEIRELEQALDETRAGRGGLVFVEAASGEGKTWLLQELRRRAAQEVVWVLRGHAYDEGAPRPYRVLAGVVGEAITRLEQEPEERAGLAGRVGEHATAVCEAFPSLRRIFPESAAQPFDLAPYSDVRRQMALSAFLNALGTSARPALVLIDDAQWADEPTLKLLARWQAMASEQPRYVLIVVAFRSEQTSADAPLREAQPNKHIHLARFAAEDVRRQLASMAGELPAEAVDAIIEHADGNPFLVTASLFGLLESGALSADSDRWKIDPKRLAELQPSEQVGSVLARRIDDLSPDARRFFTAASLLGRSFDPVLAAHVAGMEPSEALRIALGAGVRLVWSDRTGGSISFLHDRIREALLATLSPDERRALHGKAAEHIESTDPDRVFELAFHHDASGDSERALPFALAAAEQARARFALDVAARFFRIAARGAGDDATRFRIAKELGAILTLRSRHDEAAAELTRALELAPTAKDRADVEEWWGMAETGRGNLGAACEHSEQALRLIGRRVPESKMFCLLWFLWELFVQVLHTKLPRLFVARRDLGSAKADEELLAIRLYNNLQISYFFSRGYLWVMWGHLRALNLAERYPPTLELGHAYGNHGPVTSAFPRFFERGLRLSAAGARLCEERGDPLGTAWALTFHGTILHGCARFTESLEVCRKAWRLFEEAGDRFRAETNLMMIGMTQFRLGDLASARATADLMWQRGKQAESQYSLAWALELMALANEGQVPGDWIEREVERSRDNMQSLLGLRIAEGARLLREGDPGEAATVLGDAARLHAQTVRAFNDLTAPLPAYLATALRTQAEQAPAWDPVLRRRLVARARHAVKRALAVARGFRNNLPHALRESAYIAAMAGHAKAARLHIDESIAVAESLGARREHALSLEARGKIGLALGWSHADQDVARGSEELRTIRRQASPEAHHVESPPITLSLVDRFATLLETGRRIATALAPEAIFSELDRASRMLLRAEHCAILERSEDGEELRPIYGDAGMPISQSLTKLAIERGQAIAEPAGQGGEPADEALRRGGMRSALCVPIRVRSRIFGCLCVAHSEVRGLFGDEEMRIGEFLAALVGAALENAEGFAQVEAFSRELEVRVEERTAELLQAGKMAAIGTLVAGLSHELNNPLGVILGYVQTLLRHVSETDFSRKPLLAVEKHTLRCRDLVHALLDFSRHGTHEHKKISPIELLEGVVTLVAGEARTREVLLEMGIDDADIPDITVSRRDIESAVLNLLSNALDASPKGSAVRLSVRAASKEARQGVLITVKDRGPGIASSHLPHIFDPFFTTKPEGRGTGLGLSLAQRIVEQHGGHIDVQTAEGAGTAMLLWLPAGNDRPRPTAPPPDAPLQRGDS